jgi:hypothetical protein
LLSSADLTKQPRDAITLCFQPSFIFLPFGSFPRLAALFGPFVEAPLVPLVRELSSFPVLPLASQDDRHTDFRKAAFQLPVVTVSPEVPFFAFTMLPADNLDLDRHPFAFRAGYRDRQSLVRYTTAVSCSRAGSQI